MQNLPNVGIAAPLRNYDVTVYGYPNHLSGRNLEETRQNILGTISFVNKSNFEVIMKNPIMTYNDNTSDLIKGLSGGGVYYEKDNDLTLVGVFKGLKSPTGGYGGLCAIDINEINIMLDQYDLPDLTPSCILSFDTYLVDAFSCHDMIISQVLTSKAKEIKAISPKIIANLLKEKLFLPHESKSLINNNLWNGWILLLTYIFIDKEECINNSNFSKRTKDGECQNIKFYYSDSLVTLESIIRHLITELYDELKHKDYVVINTSKPSGAFYLSEKRIRQIVRQIDTVTLFRNGIAIDDPHCAKDVSCVHIQQFALKINEIEDRDDWDLLYEQIRDRIKGVFENAV